MQVLVLCFLEEKVIPPGILPIVFFLLTALSALCRFCYREEKALRFKRSKWIIETANSKIRKKQGARNPTHSHACAIKPGPWPVTQHHSGTKQVDAVHGDGVSFGLNGYILVLMVN